jgi:hypothetical protein
MELPDFLVPIEETPDELFKRTGSPTFDPANQPQVQPVQQPQVSQSEAFTQETGIPAYNPEVDGEAPDTGADFLVPMQEPDPDPYDWTIAGAPLPETLRPVGDMLAGLNQSLADVAGVAVDDIDIIMRNLGMDGLMEKPGDGAKSLIKGMESLGIAADKKKAVNKFLADLGEATGENLIALSAFFAAAPMMMGAKGSGTISTIARELGEAMIRNPATAVAADAAAGMGGETGAQFGSNFGPIGEQLGGLTGSFAGAGAALTGINMAKGIGSSIKRGMQINRTGAGATGQAPLLTNNAPDVNVISQSIRGDQLKVDSMIDRLTQRMTQSADPVRNARQLQTLQRDAYRRARQIETADYWSAVDTKKTVPTGEIKEWTNNLLKATVKEGRAEELPNDLMRMLKSMPADASIERLRTVRRLAFHRLQSGTVPSQQGQLPLNDRLRANLTSLTKQIDDQIEKAYPNDLALKKASAFSRWLHDRFTRGPVAQFARPRSTEEQLPNLMSGAKQASRDDRFFGANKDIADKLEMPALQTAAEQFMRGQLDEEITRIGPQQAAKFLKQPSTRAFMEQYPKVAAEWQSTSKKLTDLMTYRKEVMNSAFMKVTDEQPETAIRQLISSKDRVKNARTLMKRIGKNPDAVDAAKNQYILSLEDVAGGNPAKILHILASDDSRRAARTILGNDLDRLERIARDADEMLKLDQGIPRYLLRKGSRVFGALLGRRLNTGTLQAPEFGGKLSQRLMDDWLGSADPELFARAVRNPSYEAILKARVPQSVSEVRKLQTLLRRAIRVEEASERVIGPMLPSDGEDDDE